MRLARVLAFLTVVLLVSGALHAGYKQGKRYLGRLTVNGWSLFEKDGRPMLVQSRYAKTVTGATPLFQWGVSAPTMKSGALRMHADASGALRMSRTPATGADWTFEILEEYHPKVHRHGERFQVGTEGLRFRARVGDGPFRGWYLAPVTLSEEHQKMADEGPIFRPLTLVKDQESAAILVYLDAEYSMSK